MKKFLKVMTVFFIVSMVLAGCVGGSNTSAGQSLEELLGLGQKYLSEGNFEEAVVAFEKAINIDSKCEDAYIGLADAYVGLGDTEKALAVLEEGFKLTQGMAIGAKKKRLEQGDYSLGGGNAYEPDGRRKQQVVYTEQGYTITEFDEYGRVISTETHSFSTGEELVLLNQYAYDGASEQYFKNETYLQNVYQGYSLFEYDEQGRIIIHEQFSETDRLTRRVETAYDGDKFESKESMYDTDGKLLAVYVSNYDKDQRTNFCVYDKDGKLVQKLDPVSGEIIMQE